MLSSTLLPSNVRLNPARITLARERAGLTKAMLAERLGVTPRLLQTYESDGAPAGRANELAELLGVEPVFFSRDLRAVVADDQGFFRARRRATAKQLGAARATATIGAEFYDAIVERFRLPTVHLPDLDNYAPEVAADALRSSWGMGTGPLPNLIQLGEKHGVRVLSLPGEAQTIDAFSLWLDGSPYVFLSTEKTPERSRFDLAHELGHLVMHSRLEADGRPRRSDRDLEAEADQFASAFLMNKRDILAHAGREPAIHQILQLRSRYKTSAMATTKRLFDLEKLSDWSYRQNCVQLTQRGFRTGEPGGMPEREASRVISIVIAKLREQGKSIDDLGDELGIPRQELHELTFGRVAYAIPRPNKAQSAPVSSDASQRPTLRLIPGGK